MGFEYVLSNLSQTNQYKELIDFTKNVVTPRKQN